MVDIYSLIFKSIQSDLTKSGQSISIFGKEWRNVVNDIRNAKGLGNKISAAFSTGLSDNDISRLKEYNNLISKGQNPQTAYYRTLKNASAAAQDLAMKANGAAVSEEALTAATNKLTIAERIATVASKAMGIALQVALNVGVALAINGIITLIDYLVNKEQKAIETANELGKAYKDQKDRLSDLKQEYLDIVDSSKSETEKTKDLYEWKKKLIKAYGYEKDAIEGVTTARATGLKFFDEEEQKDAQELINKTLDEYEKAYKKVYGGSVGSKTGYANGILSPDALDWLKQYKDIVAEISDIDVENSDTELSFSFGDNIYDAITRINEVLTGLNTLENNGVELTYAQKEVKRLFKSYLDEYEKAKTEAETILSETGSALFTDQFVEFLKIDENKLDKVNADNFETWKEKFRKYLEENAKELLKDTNFVKIMDEYFSDLRIELFPDTLVSQNNKYGYSLSALSEKLEALGDTIKDVSAKQSTIQSALEKVRAGTSLTSDEMQKLGDAYPDLLGKFEETVDGWTIGADELIDANDKIVESAKDAINEQKKLLNDTISKIRAQLANTPVINSKSDYDEWQAKQAQLNKDLKDAQNQLQGLDNLSKTFSSNLSNLNKKLEEFNNTLKTYSSNLSTGVSAQKEMNENGKISASTLESLLSLGDDYIKCITVENGIIKFNADIFKEVTKAKLDDEIATLKLAQAEAIHARIEDAQYNKGKEGAKLQAIIDETNLKLKAAQALRDGLDETWDNELKDNSGSSSDPIKDAYAEKQKELKHLLEMEKITQAQYYEMLFGSDEYKALLAGRAKYRDELNSIDEEYYKYQQNLYKENADKQFDDLDDRYKRGIITAEQYAQALHDLGQELYGEDSIYGGTEFAIKALEELDKKVKETSDDIYSELKDSLSADGDRLLDDVLADADKLSEKNIKLFSDDPKTFKKNAEDIFETVSKSAQDALERELITPERYKEIIDKYSKGLDTGIIQDAYDDAFDKIADDGKDNLDKMLIAPDGYFKLLDEWGKKLNISEDVIKKLKEALSESDYLDAWDLENGFDSKKSADNFELRAERIKYIFKLAEQLYGKNGQKNLKAYNALINQGLEDVESLVEDYYDAEIKKLEKINDEEEKRQKALELQLNLIKARQKLEEAKNNRNQLIFHNGTFEYVADQDAVMSAEEDVAEAKKAILEQEREDQKEALENQKEETLKFFNSVGGKLDDFIDRVKKFLSGDKDAFKVDESKAKTGSDTKSDNESNTNSVTTTTGSKDKTITSATDKTEINADNVEVKTGTGTSAVADTTDTVTTEEPVVSINDLVSNIDINVTAISDKATEISDAVKGTFDVAKAFADGFNFENLVRALGGNPTAEAVKNFQDSYNATLVGKQITPSTLPSNITNNSSTTNNSAKTIINIEKIFENLYMPEGTTKEQVEAFFKHLNSAILQRIPQALIEVSK